MNVRLQTANTQRTSLLADVDVRLGADFELRAEIVAANTRNPVRAVRTFIARRRALDILLV